MSIPLYNIERTARGNINRLQPMKNTVVEMCRIEDVNLKDRLVTAYFFDSGKIVTNVQYCLPYYGLGTGITFAPTKGALGIASWDATGRPIIISFTCPTGIGQDGKESRYLPQLGPHNLPDLLDGEVMVSSSGRSFVRFDKLGGFMLSNAFFGYISIDENGKYEVNVENAVFTVNGTTTEEYLVDYQNSMEIIKGIHESETGHGTDNRLLLCYEIRVGDKMVFGITPEGKVITGEEEDNEERVQRRKRKRANNQGSARRFSRTKRNS